MPAVSVLLPCYNAAATLEEALDSLQCQTLRDFEILAVDDGSTDGTLEILSRRAQGDARLRVLARPHNGVIEASNAGLAVCQAAYVARMDADDRAHPQRLALQAAYLDAHPKVDVVCSQVAGFPAENLRAGFMIYIEWLNGLLTDEDIRREMFVESPIPNPSAMFRKQVVLDIGGYQDHGWPEDYDLWLRLYLVRARFAKLGQVLLEWRDHPPRLTRTDQRYSLENFLRAKAHYLCRGPLADREAVIIWGAGMMGRRLAKQLLHLRAPLVAFVDIDPRKIGHTRRGRPVIAPEALLEWWRRFERPVVVAAVGARGARALIRQRLVEMGLREGQDWWGAA
jgi:glycosyltransferase involved in cell wall biosynthesis